MKDESAHRPAGGAQSQPEPRPPDRREVPEAVEAGEQKGDRDLEMFMPMKSIGCVISARSVAGKMFDLYLIDLLKNASPPL